MDDRTKIAAEIAASIAGRWSEKLADGSFRYPHPDDVCGVAQEYADSLLKRMKDTVPKEERRQVQAELPSPEQTVLAEHEPTFRVFKPALIEAWIKLTNDDGPFMIAEVRKAKAWIAANPQKAPRDMPRFMNNWMLKAWDTHRKTIPSAKPGSDWRSKYQGDVP
jgi:hypothetical protein